MERKREKFYREAAGEVREERVRDGLALLEHEV
jgi:hypothetical protein